MSTTYDPSKVIFMTNAFDTLKNDDYQTTSITIPGSVAVGASSSVTYSSDITTGTSGSIVDARFQTSKLATRDYFVSVQLSLTRNGSMGTYSIFVDVYRVSPTTVRAQALVSNPYGSAMTGQAGDETLTFKIRTFRAPFST